MLHPDTLIIGGGNLAYYLGEAGQPAEAAAQFRELLDDFLRVLGPDHPDTLTTRANLADWLGEAGQPAQAASQFRELLADRLRVLGPDHPDTLTALGNLARWLGEAGQPAQAATQFRDLLTTGCGSWDPTTPDPRRPWQPRQLAGRGRAARPGGRPVPRPAHRLAAGPGTRPPRNPHRP